MELANLKNQIPPPSTNDNDNKEKNKTLIGDDGVIKPGSKIRPEISIDQVEKLAERLYGITIDDIKELVSYDDRNFLIHEDRNIKNPLITNNWQHGYVLKILNAHDSQNLEFVEAQTQVMVFLRQQDFTCPNPIMNVYGKYYSVESLTGVKYVIRLLEYQPGEILHEVPSTNHLFYQSGEYAARIDKALKNFSHEGLTKRKGLWMLQAVPKLKDFIYVIQDHTRKEIVEQVIAAFEEKVVAYIDKFESGPIHGDFNEQNIIVTKPKNQKDYRIAGILDFGDVCIAPYVFELAIAMTYMMVQTRDLATGGLVLAGYTSIRIVPDNEKDVLKICVASRLCQSLVLGAYTHSLDPDNDYLLITQKAGWELLESIWKQHNDKVDEIWFSTADNYLKQSVK